MAGTSAEVLVPGFQMLLVPELEAVTALLAGPVPSMHTVAPSELPSDWRSRDFHHTDNANGNVQFLSVTIACTRNGSCYPDAGTSSQPCLA